MSNEIYSAGILPYSIYLGTIYFLLGRDNDNKWSDFGGRLEYKDKYEHENTASREFFEETLGCIYDFDYCKKILKHKKCPKIVSKTGLGHPYYMYLLKLNYNEDYRQKFTSTKNFINYAIYNVDKKYTEKNDIRWVSLETIEYSIQNKNMLIMRNVFANSFKHNKEFILKNII